MKTICVYVKDMVEAREEVNWIIQDFPCFVKVETVEFDYVEVTILCREEDAGAIEKRLANFV